MPYKTTDIPLNELLLNISNKWLHTAKCKFKSAEQEPDVMGKRLIEHGAKCYFNCAKELQLHAQSWEPTFNFLAEVIKQNSKCPRRRWLYDIILSFFPDSFIHYGVGKIMSRPSEPVNNSSLWNRFTVRH